MFRVLRGQRVRGDEMFSTTSAVRGGGAVRAETCCDHLSDRHEAHDMAHDRIVLSPQCSAVHQPAGQPLRDARRGAGRRALGGPGVAGSGGVHGAGGGVPQPAVPDSSPGSGLGAAHLPGQRQAR